MILTYIQFKVGSTLTSAVPRYHNLSLQKTNKKHQTINITPCINKCMKWNFNSVVITRCD